MDRNTTISSNSLLIACPDIAKEWHPKKNGTLTPKNVTVGSRENVWWICEKGHEWENTIYNRLKGRGCPICGKNKRIENLRKTLLKKSGSLVDTNSELAKEWHPTKNKEFTANDISAGSNISVWWLGKCGHEWQDSVYHRSSGRGCPICSKETKKQKWIKTRINISGSLSDSHPNLAKEWHPTKNENLTTNDVSAGSTKNVWWLGKCGHEWNAKINSRARGVGCPICAGQKVLPGFNDLQTKFPKLAEEWHPTKNGKLKPTDVMPMSMKKVWWLGKCGHEWEMQVSSRSSQRCGCPICAGERHTSFPEQALFYYCLLETKAINRYVENKFELDIFLPEQKTAIEYDGMRYHNSEKAIKKEERKNSYCQKAGIRLIRIKESTENKIINDIIYYKYTSSYDHLAWAITSVFRLIEPTFNIPSIDLKRDQGKIYAQYLQIEKNNSLAEKCPELISEWDYSKNKISPTLIPAASNKSVFWICANGHEWSAKIESRMMGRGCPICAGKKVLAGYNDLKTKNPALAKEWHPTKNGPMLPSDVTISSGKKVWWICEKGHEWETTIHSRSKGTGCPICAKKKRIASVIKSQISQKGSLFDRNPQLAKEWHPTKNGDLSAHDVLVGSNKKVWWICNYGHEWEAKVNDRSHGTGCPICWKSK